MLLDAATTSYVAVAGTGVGLLGLGAALGANLRLRALRRAYAGVSEAADAGNLLAQMSAQAGGIESLHEETAQLGEGLSALRADLSDAIRHVAVVRYDAFADMGGRMSFSVALLDDAGDGLVLTSINGRSETRSYAKGVKGGVSEAPLSPEEQQSIGYARRGMRGAGRSRGERATGEVAVQPDSADRSPAS